jgi:hypothetical protein
MCGSSLSEVVGVPLVWVGDAFVGLLDAVPGAVDYAESVLFYELEVLEGDGGGAMGREDDAAVFLSAVDGF